MLDPSLQLAISILTPLLSALGAGLLVHWLTRRRDLESARRRQRIDYLLAAYRKLEAVAHRDLADGGQGLEEAYSEILLFGDASQVELAQRFARDFATNGTAPLDELLLALRRDLRAELGLGEVPLRAVSAIRIASGGLAQSGPTHFDSAWTSRRREVVGGLTAAAPRALTADLSEAKKVVDQAPGAAVVTAYQEIGRALRTAIGDDSEVTTADPLDLARAAHARRLISDGSLTAVEGLGIMADLAQAEGSGTGLSTKRAHDYLMLANAALYAIRSEVAKSGG